MAVFSWQPRPTVNFGHVWTPLAGLQLKTATGSFLSFSLQIDSGAVISLLRRSAAEVLNLDLQSGRAISLTSVGPGKTGAFVHFILTRFSPDLELLVPFAIADHEEVPNLLGRLGVFTRLAVEFDPTLRRTFIRDPTGA
jgi:hypothetical protein